VHATLFGNILLSIPDKDERAIKVSTVATFASFTGGGEGVGPTQTYYTTNASVSFTLSHSGEYTEIFHPNFFIIMNELLNQLMFKLLP